MGGLTVRQENNIFETKVILPALKGHERSQQMTCKHWEKIEFIRTPELIKLKYLWLSRHGVFLMI
jgi:hypothetical protein